MPKNHFNEITKVGGDKEGSKKRCGHVQLADIEGWRQGVELSTLRKRTLWKNVNPHCSNHGEARSVATQRRDSHRAVYFAGRYLAFQGSVSFRTNRCKKVRRSGGDMYKQLSKRNTKQISQ